MSSPGDQDGHNGEGVGVGGGGVAPPPGCVRSELSGYEGDSGVRTLSASPGGEDKSVSLMLVLLFLHPSGLIYGLKETLEC